MSVLEVVLIGVALAMDAFALTVANCATYRKTLNRLKEWSMPATFAIFQFIMPVAGFYIGSVFAQYLSSFSKYLTAGIFLILAAKIVFDNVKELRESKKEKEASATAEISPEDKEKSGEAEECKNSKASGGKFTVSVLILQAVATSIDALAVGVTFAVELTFSVFAAAAIIGGVTFLIVAAALLIGKYLGKLLGKYATWFGAAILLVLSVKNLIDALI